MLPIATFADLGAKPGPPRCPNRVSKMKKNLPKWYPKAFEKQSNALKAFMAAKMVPNAAQTVLQRVENA